MIVGVVAILSRPFGENHPIVRHCDLSAFQTVHSSNQGEYNFSDLLKPFDIYIHALSKPIVAVATITTATTTPTFTTTMSFITSSTSAADTTSPTPLLQAPLLH